MRIRALAASVMSAGTLAGVLAGVVATGAPAASAGTTSPASGAAIPVRHFNVGGSPGDAAVDPGRGAVWVGTGSAVVRIREATQRIAARVRFDGYFVAVDPARGVVWTVNQANGTLAEISEQTNTVVRTVVLNTLIEGLAVDPRTGTVWVTTGGSLVELSEATGKVLHRSVLVSNVQFKAPYGVAADPNRGVVWVGIEQDNRPAVDGLLVEYSESAHRVIRKVSLGYGITSIAVDATHGTVWAATWSQTVRIVRESTGKVKTLPNVPNGGTGVAIDPVARRVLITGTTGTGGLIWIVSETTDKVVGQVPVGFEPVLPAVDPRTHNAYVPINFRGAVAEFRL